MTKDKKFNNQKKNHHILVAPLDWGLGHVTRCIPIIKELKRHDCTIILAVNKEGLLLLKNEYAGIEIIQIPGYKVQYSRNRKWLFIKLISQLPKILLAIFVEHYWLKKTIKKYSIDTVISDNRFGLYNKHITSIYITHQLAIKTGNFFTDKLSRLIHKLFIKKYTECWVPDFKHNGLAGELSHTRQSISSTRYIGPLSRFKKLPNAENKFDLLVCISGPEPQREIFENLILSQLKSYNGKTLFVRGLPGRDEKIISPNNLVEIVNHLSSDDLNRVFQQSKFIICRSGYTTIMDLVKIGKQAILVPTPGQTEQEYLAKYLMEKKYFLSIKQEDFMVSKALNEASVFPYVKCEDEMEEYKNAIKEFVLRLNHTISNS